MPILFYGHRDTEDHKRRLYNEHLHRVKGKVFDRYKFEDLAPPTGRWLANHWWTCGNKPHSLLAWEDDAGRGEQVVIFPGEIDWRNTLILARTMFEPLIPSAIMFRVNNTDGPLLYDY